MLSALYGSVSVSTSKSMTGALPYKADNILMQAHATCNPRRHPPWDLLRQYRWSLGARWLCQQLLTKDEAMRPTAEEASRDQWLARIGATHQQEEATEAERRALQSQHLESSLMKMSLSCVASQLNLSQLHHMNLRFKQYDASGDGRLSHVEVRQVLQDVGVQSTEELELFFESLDADHSGLVEYSEFVAGCLDIASEGVQDQLRVAFRIFDLDGSGSISKEEMAQVLTAGPAGGGGRPAAGRQDGRGRHAGHRQGRQG